MTLEDVSAVRTYAKKVLSSPRSAARYIERARAEVLQQKRLFHINSSRDGKTISASCEGSHPEDKYKLHIDLQGAEPAIQCTCPAKEKEALCKHSLGLLLWRAGNLTEERLKRQTQAITQPQELPAAASTVASEAVQQNATQERATDQAAIAHQSADPPTEQATVAYQAADAPMPPPVASTVATARKRRLPASFTKRPAEPVAKKGKAALKASPPREAAVDAGGPVKGRGQIQSKLSFQPSPKKEKPTEEKPADDEVGAAMHVTPPSAVRRQRRPAPVSARCSAQDMLDISDGELLQLCQSTIGAAAGSGNPQGSMQSLPSALPAPEPSAASGQTLIPAEIAKPMATQQHSKHRRACELAEKALEQTGALQRETPMDLTMSEPSDVQARRQRRAGSSASLAEHDAGAVEASLAPAGRTDTLTQSAGPSSGMHMPTRAPAARSMLEELLGGTYLLLADPAPTADEQQAPVKERASLQDPGSQAADKLTSAKHSDPAAAESFEDRLLGSLLTSGHDPGHINGTDMLSRNEQTEGTQSDTASGKLELPVSEVRLQISQCSAGAQTSQASLDIGMSMQPGQYPTGKKLSLRERMKLIQESR